MLGYDHTSTVPKKGGRSAGSLRLMRPIRALLLVQIFIPDSRTAIKESGDRDFQGFRGSHEAGGADPVGPSLVFLDLLEGDAHPETEVGLTQTACVAENAKTLSDVFVECGGFLIT